MMSATRPELDSLKAYGAWHSEHEVDAAADSPWHQMIWRRLRPERDLAGRRVLEIGCGRGGFACRLARHPLRPNEIVAADFSPVAVAKARKFAEDQDVRGIVWQTADIQAVLYPDATFDTIFSCETIEHVPDPPCAVRELARVLKPGGRLFLTTPNYMNSMGLYRGYCRLRGKPFDEGGQPICQLTLLPKTLAWVRRAGLRVVTVDATGHYLPFPGRSPIRVRLFDYPRWLMKWSGLHSLVVAEKPGVAGASA